MFSTNGFHLHAEYNQYISRFIAYSVYDTVTQPKLSCEHKLQNNTFSLWTIRTAEYIEPVTQSSNVRNL